MQVPVVQDGQMVDGVTHVSKYFIAWKYHYYLPLQALVVILHQKYVSNAHLESIRI